MRTPVILLKDPASSHDPYADRLASEDYQARFLSPLVTLPAADPSELRDILEDGATGRWSGVIVTSKRAVTAWTEAAVAIETRAKGKGKADAEDQAPASLGWDEVPFFAVGPATADSLRTVPTCASKPSTELVLGAAESGTGSSLGRFIVDHFSSSSQGQVSLPLLYLVGDKRSPHLPQTLSSAAPAIPFREVEVYATSPSPTLADDFSRLFASLPRSDPSSAGDRPPWVVLFSPSGGKSVLPALVPLLRPGPESPRIKVAVIGPTTESWCKDAGFVPDAVASKPDAGSLVRAIVHADEERPV